MERHKLLAGVRRKEILFPPGFTTEAGREKQVQLYYTTMSYKGISSIFCFFNRLLEKILFAMVVSAFTDFDSIPTTTHFYLSITISTVILKYGSARYIQADVCMRL